MARKILKWIGLGLLALVGIELFGMAVLLLYLQSDSGHRFAREQLEKNLDRALPGSVRIGAVEHFGWFEPTVRELEFREPHGTVVLHVDRAELDIDVSDLLTGVLTVPWAHTTGGYIVIAVQPDGRTGLEAAFATPEKRPPGAEDEGAVFTFQRIEVEHLNAVLRPAKDQTIKIRDVDGIVQLDRQKNQGIHVKLEGIRGQATEPEIAGAKLHLSRVDGWVHGAEPQVLELAFWTKLGPEGSRIDGSLSLFDRKKTPLQIRLKPHEGARAEIAAAMVLLQSWAADDVKVKIDDES